METGTATKTFHGNPTPKSSTLRDREAYFSSYLRPDKPINCEPHHTLGPVRCRALDYSTSELGIFYAHKYLNEVTNNDIQKVTITSNSRVSPLVNMDIEHNPDRGDITETSRYSSASSSVDGKANTKNYRAHSFHAGWNSLAGLLSHPPSAISVSTRNPPHPPDLKKKIRASLSKSIRLLRRKCPCSCKKSVEVKENTPKPNTPMPPPPPRLSHYQIARNSLNLKRQHLDSNPKTPTDKFTKDMEITASKIPITPNNNGVDQRPQDQAMVLPKSPRFQPAANQVPTTSQPQSVLASSVRPFTDGFTFRVPNPHSATSSTVAANVVDEDPPTRDSLEVFQPHDTVSQKPIDISESRVIDDDAASDASSDLFEIESFSAQTTTPTYTMTPTIIECYEPSVTTPEGYDRSSMRRQLLLLRR